MVITRSNTKLAKSTPNLSAEPSHKMVSTPLTSNTRRKVVPITNMRTFSVATHTSRSSATVIAQKLAAEAQHARHLAQLEIEEMEATMRAQIQGKQAELERKAAELAYQAELAAIDAESKHGSRSGRSRASVERWLHSTPRPAKIPIQQRDEPGNDYSPYNNEYEAKPINNVTCSQALPLHDVVVSTNVAVPNPTQLPQHKVSRGDGGTATDFRREDGSVGVTQLVQALQLLKDKKNLIKLPLFDGKNPIDWLMFKRAFQDTEGTFTEAENLARLSQALKGAPREAVSMLLVMAPRAFDVIDALDRRFGRPEQIVMQEVNAVRALPKLGQEVKDLNLFASRVRNCVEVAKLLQHSDYLRSPELFGALLSKLSPLLRTRWLDFAANHENLGQARVELLSNFLNREVDLVMRFGAVSEMRAAPSQRHRAHTVSESGAGGTPHEISRPNPEKLVNHQHHNNKNICLFCGLTHQLSTCQKFISLSIEEKWRFIKDNKICFRCLQKVPHNFRFCNKNKTNCAHCNRKHHTLLHNDNFSAHVNDQTEEPVNATAINSDQVLVAINNSPVDSTLRPLLKVVAVTVSGPSGSLNTFALLDDGSTATFIDADIASQIGAEGPEGRLHLDCIGGLSRKSTVQYVDFEIIGRSALQNFIIKGARSIKNLGLLAQSAPRDSLCNYSYLSDLVEELSYDVAKPTLIIGIDNWHLITASEVRKGTKSQPVAIRTPLGWVLFGFSSSKTRPVQSTYHVTLRERNELETLIKEQYRLDAIGITKHEPRSSDDQRALHILEHSARRLPNGRFQVGLLWKADDLEVPNSYPLAFSRFKNLELKMTRDPGYAERYRLNIQNMITKGYAEDCTGELPTSVCWYLPHFGVVNTNKPEKLRVVHDAAAKVQGVSLNSMLLTGPDLLQPLLDILMRFREGKIALTADIKEMFPQVKIQECDRDAQRFLWRNEPAEPIKTYRMSSMIFGACSSPSTAIYIINRNASEFEVEFPEAVHSIRTDTYMDDFIGSVDVSVEQAARLASEIVEVHKRGGFEMRGWISNKPEALSQLPTNTLSDLSVVDRSVDLGSLQSSTFTRTLGLIWQPSQDAIGFNPGLKDHSPAHLTKREVLAQVMRIYDPLGLLAPIVVRGRILFQNLWRKNLDWDERLSESDQIIWLEWFECLKSISELRVPRCYNLSDYFDLELHVFCDASELVYVTVAYWRFALQNGEVKLALIASKARVSPLKAVSIPRLELQGALIASRLANKICDAHRLKPSRRYFWCDSMTVLGWLRSDARNYKPFVAHRIGEILENTNVVEWHWVPTEHNVADDATRGKCSIEQRWFSGPNFLLSPASEWPSEAKVSTPTTLGQEELKPSLNNPKLAKHTSCTVDIMNFTNSHQLPLPVVADIIHFSSWIRLVRATARTHQFIASIFKNRGHTFQNFWVEDICLLKAPRLQPPMADLPDSRLAHHRRAFTYTGLDYFGPIEVAIGRRREKRWVALFTCMVTRAIHLEIVASLSADSALMCLRRFIARRGTPSEIFSDNGTSFVGANRQLRALYDATIPQFAAENKIAWRFVPPLAPFMGGAWERLIRSVKTALKVTLRERAPREEVLATLLTEIEAIVNARPLTHISPDADYPEALTPNHFLLGDSSGHSFPSEPLTDAALVGRSSWRKALRLADYFWRRWVREYLPTLAPRRVPGTDVAVRVGDPVLIGDGDLPRGIWPRGVIAALYPGRDGVVRVVDVRTAGGIFKRPLKNIVPL